ncbi:hypothetical protein GH733_015294, partial [Mirounga leonina]
MCVGVQHSGSCFGDIQPAMNAVASLAMGELHPGGKDGELHIAEQPAGHLVLKQERKMKESGREGCFAKTLIEYAGMKNLKSWASSSGQEVANKVKNELKGLIPTLEKNKNYSIGIEILLEKLAAYVLEEQFLVRCSQRCPAMPPAKDVFTEGKQWLSDEPESSQSETMSYNQCIVQLRVVFGRAREQGENPKRQNSVVMGRTLSQIPIMTEAVGKRQMFPQGDCFPEATAMVAANVSLQLTAQPQKLKCSEALGCSQVAFSELQGWDVNRGLPILEVRIFHIYFEKLDWQANGAQYGRREALRDTEGAPEHLEMTTKKRKHMHPSSEDVCMHAYVEEEDREGKGTDNKEFYKWVLQLPTSPAPGPVSERPPHLTRGINILAVDFRMNEPEKRIVKRLYFDYLLIKTEISLQEHLWMHSTLGRAGVPIFTCFLGIPFHFRLLLLPRLAYFLLISVLARHGVDLDCLDAKVNKQRTEHPQILDTTFSFSIMQRPSNITSYVKSFLISSGTINYLSKIPPGPPPAPAPPPSSCLMAAMLSPRTQNATPVLASLLLRTCQRLRLSPPSGALICTAPLLSHCFLLQTYSPTTQTCKGLSPDLSAFARELWSGCCLPRQRPWASIMNALIAGMQLAASHGGIWLKCMKPRLELSSNSTVSAPAEWWLLNSRVSHAVLAQHLDVPAQAMQPLHKNIYSPTVHQLFFLLLAYLVPHSKMPKRVFAAALRTACQACCHRVLLRGEHCPMPQPVIILLVQHTLSDPVGSAQERPTEHPTQCLVNHKVLEREINLYFLSLALDDGTMSHLLGALPAKPGCNTPWELISEKVQEGGSHARDGELVRKQRCLISSQQLVSKSDSKVELHLHLLPLTIKFTSQPLSQEEAIRYKAI